MKFETRRIADFVMGSCSGFLMFYGTFLGYAVGSLMILSFVVQAYRTRILDTIDKDLEVKEALNGAR